MTYYEAYDALVVALKNLLDASRANNGSIEAEANVFDAETAAEDILDQIGEF